MTLRTPLTAVVGGVLGVAALMLATLPGTSQAATSCAKGSLSLVHPGQLTARHRLAGLPTVFREQQAGQRQGLRERRRLRDRRQLGFPPSQVKWTVEPFDSSFAPGPKSFDFDINEISISSVRAKAVDFSTPYYTNPQAIVVVKGSKYRRRARRWRR